MALQPTPAPCRANAQPFGPQPPTCCATLCLRAPGCCGNAPSIEYPRLPLQELPLPSSLPSYLGQPHRPSPTHRTHAAPQQAAISRGAALLRAARLGPWTRPLQDLVSAAYRGNGKVAPRELAALGALVSGGASTAMGLSLWGYEGSGCCSFFSEPDTLAHRLLQCGHGPVVSVRNTISQNLLGR